MRQEVDRQMLANVVESEDIDALSLAELVRLFREEEEISRFAPDGVYQVDPRNGDVILYHSSRGRRPHDNRPSEPDSQAGQQDCIICQGRTTGVVDIVDLSEGFTFINKNLFPILYPFEGNGCSSASRRDRDPQVEGHFACGLHFLQWTCSQHDRDWHNMPLSDGIVVMERLAALEKKLVTDSGEFMPETESGEPGYVLIVKNYGHLVGGSLMHGHQQIAFSSVMPRRLRDNWRFEKERGERFTAYLLRENPPELMVKDYGAAMLLVPYFMRRPFDMMLLVKDTGKRYLHELSQAQVAAVAEGWCDAIRAMFIIMPEIGREIAYNVITSNGPGAGIYFEFLPYTQEIGGAEHLGLYVCQHSPKEAAARIRAALA